MRTRKNGRPGSSINRINHERVRVWPSPHLCHHCLISIEL